MIKIIIEVLVFSGQLIFLIFRIGLYVDNKKIFIQNEEKTKRRISFFLYKLTNLDEKQNWEAAEEILNITKMETR